MALDFTRCRRIWVRDDSEAGGSWSPPPPHVEFGVKQIIEHPYFLLSDDMGGMKTAQGIIAAQFLHDLLEIDRVIVVATAEVKRSVWYDEVIGQLREQLFDDKYNIVTEFHSKVRQWAHGFATGKQPLKWIVTNYEYIRTRANLELLFTYCGPRTMLILDESSAVRTHDSAQTEACMLLRWKHRQKGRKLTPIWGEPFCGRILEMNGTPLSEGPRDMFSQMNLLHPSILDCRFITHFKSRYEVEVPVLGAGGKPLQTGYFHKVIENGVEKRVPKPITRSGGYTNLDDLQARCAPYILRRESKDFGIDFALPPVPIEVSLKPDTWAHYRQMRDDMVVQLEQGIVAARQAAVKSIRLSQITSGFLSGIEPVPLMEALEGADMDDWLEQVDANPITQQVAAIGREKLDFVLEWHAERLRRNPNLKLLTWCRFVPELKRYLHEERLAFPNIPVGAACGSRIFEGEHSKRDEREMAMKLLHPKTAPQGPVTVGATQGTGALGLNFTACRTVMDMSFDFSAMKKKQGDARVNRTGQTGPVSFFYLLAVGPKGQKTIDHHVYLQRTGKIQTNDWTTAAWVKALKED